MAEPPARSVRPPHPRHFLARVRQTTLTKARNTVLESWVDVAADVGAINAGWARRQGDQFLVNGRLYGLEPNGRIYPISGAGVHQLGRGAFNALGVYNQFGRSERAEEILDLMRIGTEEREQALRAWESERGR
jgi:hypothetical protein